MSEKSSTTNNGRNDRKAAALEKNFTEMRNNKAFGR